MWSRRQRLAIPQPLSDPPPRPPDNCDDALLRERYAAFALGNFATYSAAEPLDTSDGLWAAYERHFSSNALHVRIAKHLLANADMLARVRMRTDERRILQADIEVSAEQRAEAAIMEGAEPLDPDEYDPLQDQDDAPHDPETDK